MVKSIAKLLPGGFDADWSADFHCADGRQVVMSGMNDTNALVLMDNKARKEARRYWAEVRRDIEMARAHEAACVAALEAGDYQTAYDEIYAAASIEREWGDDPIYTPYVNQIAALPGVEAE